MQSEPHASQEVPKTSSSSVQSYVDLTTATSSHSLSTKKVSKAEAYVDLTTVTGTNKLVTKPGSTAKFCVDLTAKAATSQQQVPKTIGPQVPFDPTTTAITTNTTSGIHYVDLTTVTGSQNPHRAAVDPDTDTGSDDQYSVPKKNAQREHMASTVDLTTGTGSYNPHGLGPCAPTTDTQTPEVDPNTNPRSYNPDEEVPSTHTSPLSDIPKVGRGNYFPVSEFADLDATLVTEFPADLDGKHLYAVSTCNETWQRDIKDRWHFRMVSSSRLGFHGIRKIGTCGGNFACPNPRCEFRALSEGNQPNRVDFYFPRNQNQIKICRICKHQAKREHCGVRKVVEYDPETKIAWVFLLGTHKCLIKPEFKTRREHMTQMLRESQGSVKSTQIKCVQSKLSNIHEA